MQPAKKSLAKPRQHCKVLPITLICWGLTLVVLAIYPRAPLNLDQALALLLGSVSMISVGVLTLAAQRSDRF